MEKELNIIALSAAGNSGKTSMLEYVVVLLREYQCFNEDRRFIFSLESKLIGIALDGDDKFTVEQNLDILAIQKECDIVITPCRTRNATRYAIDEFVKNKNVSVTYFCKSWQDLKFKSYFGRFNQLEAECLIDYIRNNFM